MILPFVLPRWAQPSARDEADLTEPPFFMPGIAGFTLVIGMLVGRGIGLLGPAPIPGSLGGMDVGFLGPDPIPALRGGITAGLTGLISLSFSRFYRRHAF